MRLRMPLLASACVATACVSAPALASAVPHSDRSLTIHATPSHIIAGQPVLIFGRLQGSGHADQEITLWHKVSPNHGFSVIGHTHTNAAGRYEFTRAQDIVNTNRSWFVRGPGHTHSDTIHEGVAAEVTLAPSASEGTTRHPLTFTGQVTPAHTGSRVELQVQRGADNNWETVAGGRVGADSKYSITHAWRTPGQRAVRVFFDGDVRNLPAASDPTSVVIEQRQAPYFTIDSSSPIVADGATATISGLLDVHGTSSPEAGTEVGLFARSPLGGPFALVQTTTTGSDGGYRFAVQGTTNQTYRARTISASPAQASALVFQGVQDSVNMSSSATSSTVGGQVTFSGSVAPGKSGHIAYLEYLGRDGHWHIAATAPVSAASTFSFAWRFGAAGSKEFRARVLGGPLNVGGASAPVSVTVSQPPLSALPMG
jgi:hypothetical protein